MSRLIFCALPCLALLAACGEDDAALRFNGYVEGQYVAVAPREAGRIAEIGLERGDRVAKGDVLLRLETNDAEAALAATKAELERAKAQLANLLEGRRPAEIAVTRAQLAEAEAQLVEARQSFARQKELLSNGHTSRAAFDRAKASFEAAQARAERLKREIDVQEMAAREQEIAAARNAVKAQRAQVKQAEWRLAQLTVHAPAGGIIEEVLRRTGEMTAPDAPAATLLPDGRRVVRFFVPEALRARIDTGMPLALTCDGCPTGLRAEVSFVSTQAEYTPPIIYSVESRQKLVYLVEARPQGAAAELRPGQIVDVRPATGDER